MQYFDFQYLIDKYKTEFTAIIPSEGDYNDAGDFVKGEPKRITLTGAIIGMRESRIMNSQGAYTSQDKSLYMLEPLDNALMNAKIVHKGKLYSVQSERENAGFTGVWAYVLKYVSVFKDGGSK